VVLAGPLLTLLLRLAALSRWPVMLLQLLPKVLLLTLQLLILQELQELVA
jgi:hypothetical protein